MEEEKEEVEVEEEKEELEVEEEDEENAQYSFIKHPKDGRWTHYKP